MIRLCLLLLSLALPAHATVDAWPAVHYVVGVAADDVLNIRSEPSADSEIIGSFPHDAEGIEVMRTTDDLRWGLVNTGEQRGWVSMAYMERGPGQWDGFPFALTSCFGTEPFWTLRVGETWELWEQNGGAMTAPAVELMLSVDRRDRHAAMSIAEDGRPAALVVVAQQCWDGMSDREYGLGTSLIVGAGDTMEFYSGCCTIGSYED